MPKYCVRWTKSNWNNQRGEGPATVEEFVIEADSGTAAAEKLHGQLVASRAGDLYPDDIIQAFTEDGSEWVGDKIAIVCHPEWAAEELEAALAMIGDTNRAVDVNRHIEKAKKVLEPLRHNSPALVQAWSALDQIPPLAYGRGAELALKQVEDGVKHVLLYLGHQTREHGS